MIDPQSFCANHDAACPTSVHDEHVCKYLSLRIPLKSMRHWNLPSSRAKTSRRMGWWKQEKCLAKHTAPVSICVRLPKLFGRWRSGTEGHVFAVVRDMQKGERQKKNWIRLSTRGKCEAGEAIQSTKKNGFLS